MAEASLARVRGLRLEGTASRALGRALAAVGAGALIVLVPLIYGSDDLGPIYAWMLGGGIVFGVLLQRTRFCLFCIFKDLFLFRNAKPFLAVVGALAVGSLGYLIIFESWIPDPTQGWLPPQAHIGPVGRHLVIGGLVFGLGMALSGSCISSHMYRLGEGSALAVPSLLGAAVGFGLGFAAWNPIYLSMVQPAPVVWLPASLGYGGATLLQGGILLAVTVAALVWHRRRPAAHPRPIESPRDLARRFLTERWKPAVAAVGIGVLAFLIYFKVEPLGVTAELGRLTRSTLAPTGIVPVRLEGLDTLAGCSTADTGETITTNAVFVLALIGGSLLSALAGGFFRLRLPSPGEAVRGFAGGIMLGFGAMIALGCSIGTFLSGSMAFSMSGWVFGLFMAAGIFVGIKLLGKKAATTGCSVPSAVAAPVSGGMPGASAASRWTHATPGRELFAAVDEIGDALLVDVGRDEEAFEAGHIPGAVYLPWKLVSTTVDGVEGELPEPAVVARGLAARGIAVEDRVVLYDGSGGSRAARLGFVMAQLGYPVPRLLDGAMDAWIASGRPLEAGKAEPRAAAAVPPAIPDAWPGIISGEELARRLDSVLVLDSRSPQEFSGQDLRATRGGHIPGSVNLDWRLHMDPSTGRLRPVEELRRLYEPYLEDPRPLVLSCQSGNRATHSWYVLRLLGRAEQVLLYDGSWTEWGNRAEWPVEGG